MTPAPAPPPSQPAPPRTRAHSRARFGGHRERVLARDGRSCRVCGAGKSGRRLHVHHREARRHHPDSLVTVCAACRARIHRLGAVRRWRPERLVELWTEQHPGVARQERAA